MQRWFIAEHKNQNKTKPSKIDEEMADKNVTSEVPIEKTFTVTIDEIDAREAVYISGNVSELGEWRHNRLVRLIPKGGSIWSVSIVLPAQTEVRYRYCVAVVTEESTLVSVRRWETHLAARRLLPHENLSEDKFGEYKGTVKISRGWLTEEVLVQFKLFHNAFRWKNRFGAQSLQIKVTPLTLALNADAPCSPEEASLSADTGECTEVSDVQVEVSKLSEESCLPHPQSQFGTVYVSTDVMLVSVRGPAADSLSYLLDVYARKSEGAEVPVHVASAYLLGDVLQQGSEARLDLPLMCHVRQRPVGSVRVDVLVVRPLPEPLCDLSLTYSKHWDQSWTGLEVGHRGLGASFKTKEGNEIRENTIASLKHAAASGADMLEFDVQLSRDKVPVIYHDFHVCISMKRKKQLDCSDMLELPVKDLTLEQLQQLKVYHLVEGRSNEMRFNDEDLEEHQPFPTLQHALSAVDPHIGFNVELKWNMELKDGTFELDNPFDMNTYVDKVLEVVLKHAGDRKIVFSGFNPDICTMLRYKQNKYPVMFLTQGVTLRYPCYRDLRCASIPAAVRHALNIDILGIVAHTEDILRDPTQVKLARDAGLVIFCWGDDNNNKDTIRKLKELGLHAVIYDKLDQYTTKEVKESIFLVEARDSQKELLRMARSSDGESASEPASALLHSALERAARDVHAAESIATITSQYIKNSDLIQSSDKELQHKKSSSFLGLFPSPASELSPAPAKRSRSNAQDLN